MSNYSEDGREEPEVIAVRREPGHWNDPLMTVAQHERIVADKDAEIASLKVKFDQVTEGNTKLHKLWTEALRAQPACQVGGDANPVAEVVSGYSGDPDTRGSKALKVIDLSTVNIGDKLFSAALAPAAVAFVMPEYDYLELRTPDSPNQISAIARNSTLDEVARLNRRAIPVELLGRIVNRDHLHTTEWWRDVTELRTLLGRD